MRAFLLRLVCAGYGLALGSRRHHSRRADGDVATMAIADKLWWGYKYFVRAVEHSAPGSGIEEYFAGQELRFPLPAGFAANSSAVLAGAGDLLASGHLRADNTTRLWDEVREFLFGAELAIANLESPVVPSRAVSAPPRNILAAPPLNTSAEMLRVYTDDGRGFGFFSMANNHCVDQGVDGLRETLDVLDAHGCGHVGTARTSAEQANVPIVVRNGIRIGVVSYTFSVNGCVVPAGAEYAVNRVPLNTPDADMTLIRRHVRTARENGADVVVACLHWGLEFESYPVQAVIDRGHRVLELGVDVILGNHPHVIQPIERHRFIDPFTGRQKYGVIAYALGDLLSYLPAVPNSMLANLIRVTLTKGVEDGESITRVSDVEVMPVYRQLSFSGRRCVNVRLRNLSALARAQRTTGRTASGAGLTCAQRREVRRLDALAARVLAHR